MRLHSEDRTIYSRLLRGKAGLELESHRIDLQGHLAQSPHPFPDNPYIDRDFGEAQIEINTPPKPEPEEAIGFLRGQLTNVHRTLEKQQELLWPFSNPPVIRDEQDIAVAHYEGERLYNYRYRLYLAERYGKYKMTYSGIHFNYSFDEEMLRYNQKLEQEAGSQVPDAFSDYRDLFYVKLAGMVLRYSWAVVALLAASPLVDNSFFEAGKTGESLFTGFASLRCSELGYWNPFSPVLSYESVKAYADSIESFIDRGLLLHARELYYPVRIKPPGTYTLEALRGKGIDHIELRQIDLNPFAREGIDLRDMKFLGLLLIWLASADMPAPSLTEQMQALQNHKTAAAYDWDLAKILLPGQEKRTLRECLAALLKQMRVFYAEVPEAEEPLAYQEEKVRTEAARYAVRVRTMFGKDYAGEGLKWARKVQDSIIRQNPEKW